MAQGLQIFDEDGINVLDTDSGTVKIMGRFKGRVNTTVTSSLFMTETPFYIILPRKRYGHSDFINVTFSGNTCTVINNEFESNQGRTVRYTVYVGVY